MMVNGYQIKEAIKQQTIRRDAATALFTNSTRKYPNEDKESPVNVMFELLKAELAISQLQIAQMKYNLEVKVNVMGENMSLAEAIKRIGGPSRAEKLWKTLAVDTGNNRRNLFMDDGIDPTRTFAVPTITNAEALKLAKGAAKHSGELRAAIAIGNGTNVLLDYLDPELFD